MHGTKDNYMHIVFLSLSFFWGLAFFFGGWGVEGGGSVLVFFVCRRFFLVLLSYSLQAQIDSFISNVFIFFCCSPDSLQLREFIYRRLI